MEERNWTDYVEFCCKGEQRNGTVTGKGKESIEDFLKGR